MICTYKILIVTHFLCARYTLPRRIERLKLDFQFKFAALSILIYLKYRVLVFSWYLPSAFKSGLPTQSDLIDALFKCKISIGIRMGF